MTKAKATKTKVNSVKNSVDEKKERPQNKHLKPMKPGETLNPNGRPKGRRSFQTLLTLAIQTYEQKIVDAHNKKEKDKSKHITVDDVDVEKDIFQQLVDRARTGDQKAIDSFLDRTQGKATQPIQVAGMISTLKSDADIAEAKKEIMAWQEMWTKQPTQKKQDDNKPKRRTHRKGS